MEMKSMTTADPQVAKKNRYTLLALVAIFAMPPLLGWLFIMNPHWLPGTTINHGELIHPPRPVSDLQLSFIETGQPLDWSELRDKWVFAVISNGDCDQQCLSQLIHIRQLRKALAADRRRVERIFIQLPDTADHTPVPPPMAGLEGTLLLKSDNPGTLQAVRALFELEQVDASSHMFIIDPRGDLMMRHNLVQLKPKEILKDLEMLLKASANWVQGE